MKWLLPFFLLLAACATPQPGYRDQSAAISSTARFDAVTFSGEWSVIAAYPSQYFPDCTVQSFRFDLTTANRFQGICAGSKTPYIEAEIATDPLGRLQILTSDLGRTDRALWVLWLSEDLQTAAIGTPSGEMGWVLNRGQGLRPDRFRAAREVLDFNGYDLSGLREVTR